MSGPAVTPTTVPGFFGKLPEQGDFLSRRLPPEFLRVWDPWLQASLAESHEVLGDRWLDAYLTSPIWRFVLTPGIAGQASWAGLLMPSVDRVGRYFPFTVARAVPRGGNPFQVLASGADWFSRTQSLMLAALEGDLTVEQLDARLGEAAPLDIQPLSGAAPTDIRTSEAHGWRLPLQDPSLLADSLPALLHHALGELFCGYSLWWSRGSEQLPPSLLVCQGLPADAAFSALYTGDWTQGPWWNLGDLAT